MPATQGAVNWPQQGPSATVLVFEEELPLVDSSIDRMLLVHLLEHTENPRETLKEIWRVLAPGGRLVVVVPNRRGVWARFEHTPFGNGRPFSRGQLTSLLREANFTPGAWADALFFPPSHRRFVLKLPSAARADRAAVLADVLGGDRGRGAEAALSGPAGHPAGLAPGVRAGAFAARRHAGGAGSVLSLAAWVGTAAATVAAALAGPQVDVALVLAVDVSDSMDAGELAVQRAGYVAALSHPTSCARCARARAAGWRSPISNGQAASGASRWSAGDHRQARECRPLCREAGGAAVPDLPQHLHFERAGLRPAASRRQRGRPPIGR